MRRRPEPLAAVRSPGRFVALTRQAFMHRRKTMQKILQGIGAEGLHPPADPAGLLRSVELDPAARPETLGVVEWARLADALGDVARGQAT